MNPEPPKTYAELIAAHGTYSEFCVAIWTACKAGEITLQETTNAIQKYAADLVAAIERDPEATKSRPPV